MTNQILNLQKKSIAMPVIELYNLNKDQQLNTAPDYQRGLVWDTKQSQMYIESLLIGIPSNAFSLFENQDQDQTYDVVDGLQRLNAINLFMNNKLKLPISEYLINLNNLFYRQLTIKKKFDFKHTTIHVTTITATATATATDIYKLKLEWFLRINAQNTPLTTKHINKISKQLNN